MKKDVANLLEDATEKACKRIQEEKEERKLILMKLTNLENKIGELIKKIE